MKKSERPTYDVGDACPRVRCRGALTGPFLYTDPTLPLVAPRAFLRCARCGQRYQAEAQPTLTLQEVL